MQSNSIHIQIFREKNDTSKKLMTHYNHIKYYDKG